MFWCCLWKQKTSTSTRTKHLIAKTETITVPVTTNPMHKAEKEETTFIVG